MAIICDIDNTLLRSGIYPMPKTINAIKGQQVFLITGRLESERAKTVQTLKKYGIQYSALLMNNVGPDMASQLRSKRVNAHTAMGRASISLAIDDDQHAQTLYKQLGIPNVTGP
jgi:predicted Fe-Mo cluster-binding NifX family protein